MQNQLQCIDAELEKDRFKGLEMREEKSMQCKFLQNIYLEYFVIFRAS